MKIKAKRIGLYLFPGILLILSVVLIAVLQPRRLTENAADSLLTDHRVIVTGEPRLSFQPVEQQTDTGFIFYTGSKVSPEAYAPVMRKIAAEGFLVIVPKMPANMAVLGADRAENVMIEHPEIRKWVIGGHSLGGVMASRFVFKNPGLMAGLVFWASYPAKSYDLSGRSIPVISIYGSRDGLASPREVALSEPLLPPDTVWVEIAGGNHAYFGTYGEQKGDLKATLTRENQQNQIVRATVAMLSEIDSR